jgi:hypothetical protein
LIAGLLSLCSPVVATPVKLAGWDFNGYSGFGASPQAPTTTNAGVTVVGLTRGSGLTTNPTAAANAWGANGWNTALNDFASAVADSKFATFSLAPTTAPVSFGMIDPYNIRRSGSGAATGQWQYQLNAGPFVNLGDPITWGGTTSGTGNGQGSIDLAAVAELQNVPVGTTVTFRIVNWGASGSGGTWYFNNFQTGDDLSITGTVDPGGIDTTPPTIASRFPADNAVDVTPGSVGFIELTLSEPVNPGTGTILLRESGGATVQSFVVNDTNDVAIDTETKTQVTLFLGEGLLLRDKSYYITIPATAFPDLAGNPFAGISDDSGWNFSMAPTPADPRVVVNKYSNGTVDTVELLVVGTQVPGSTVDMRGMILKDFTTNMSGDNGGKYEFTTDPLWSDVPAGTLVVITNDASATDPDSSDFVIRVGLTNPTYFTKVGGGSFDISTTDMILIKEAGSGDAGLAGGIHLLAGGAPGSLFINFPGAKLIAGTGGSGVVANNTTGQLDDFVLTEDATGGVSLSSANFGIANNGNNRGFIKLLRGELVSDGDGSATLVNATPASPFASKGIFGRGLADQSVQLTVVSSSPSITLTEMTIQVPAAFGSPSSVTLSGAGGAGAASSIAGQTVTITSAAATATSPLVITLGGIATPTPALLTDTGNYAFALSTKGSAGTLTPIDLQPVARVLVPIEVLRDVDAAGVSLDLGSVVAVEGVCTMDNFSLTNTQAYLQDGTAGINLFSNVLLNTPLATGRRYAVLGTVQQFNGLTEIVPLTEDNIIDLGADTLPDPLLLTVPALLAAAEDHEGSLLKVENLFKVSGTWGSGQNIVLRDSGGELLTVRVQPASTALPEPSYPVTITGVLTQFDSSSPFTSGYQLLPRTPADLAMGTLSDFEAWLAATGATGGMGGDSDFDGRDNGFEYAFGLNPVSGGSVNPFVVPFSPATGTFTYSRRKPSLTGLDYRYEYSTDLGTVWQDLVPALPEVSNNGDPVESITIEVPAALLDEPRLFIRLIAD